MVPSAGFISNENIAVELHPTPLLGAERGIRWLGLQSREDILVS
jgi:hypothetical protein